MKKILLILCAVVVMSGCSNPFLDAKEYEMRCGECIKNNGYDFKNYPSECDDCTIIPTVHMLKQIK